MLYPLSYRRGGRRRPVVLRRDADEPTGSLPSAAEEAAAREAELDHPRHARWPNPRVRSADRHTSVFPGAVVHSVPSGATSSSRSSPTAAAMCWKSRS